MKTIKILMLAFSVFLFGNAYSQLNPMGSMYFQNQYLGNPAMAGIAGGWELNGTYKAQWTAIDGAPAMQAVTATYGTESKKVGLGFNFYNEGAGVIRRTSFKGSYAYHLTLNNKSSYIDFGLSAGVMDEWIDFNKVKGNLTDGSLYNFNQRKLYFDGDFGVAYRNDYLTVQGSLPNLKRLLKKDLQRAVADRFLYMASASYKIKNESGALSVIEPKVMYRGVENYKDIFDAGAQIQFWGDKLIMNGMYHTTNSVTAGIGTVYKDQLSVLCQYTTNTADLQTYSNGEFEIALKYNFR